MKSELFFVVVYMSVGRCNVRENIENIDIQTLRTKYPDLYKLPNAVLGT